METLLRHKRLLLISGIALVVLFTAAIAAFLFGGSRQARPTVVASPSLTPSPTVSVSPKLLPGQVGNLQQVQQQDPQERNPVLVKLPKVTAYWKLDVGGQDQAGYILVAHVFYARGQDPQQKINEQRPYIEKFVSSTGQQPGTYRIDYQSTQF